MKEIKNNETVQEREHRLIEDQKPKEHKNKANVVVVDFSTPEDFSDLDYSNELKFGKIIAEYILGEDSSAWAFIKLTKKEQEISENINIEDEIKNGNTTPSAGYFKVEFKPEVLSEIKKFPKWKSQISLFLYKCIATQKPYEEMISDYNIAVMKGTIDPI